MSKLKSMMAPVDSAGAGLIPLIRSMDGLVGYWPLDDPSGSAIRCINPALAVGRNVVVNGDMETGTPPDNWSTPGDGTLSSEAVIVHGGSVSLKYEKGSTAGIADRSWSHTLTNLRVSGSYTLTAWVYIPSTSGASVVQMLCGTAVAGGFVAESDSTTDTDAWTELTFTFVATAATMYIVFINSVADSTGDITYTDDVTLTQLNIAASTAFPGAELITDGDMEAVGVGDWSVGLSATLTKETTDPYEGTQNLRVAYNGTANPYAYQSILTSGEWYQITGVARGDGTVAPRIVSGSNLDETLLTSTAWQLFSFKWIADSAVLALRIVASAAGYAEFDIISVRKINPMTGEVTGSTIYQPATSKLLYSHLLDGVNDVDDVWSPELNSAWNPLAGTMLIFAKVADAGVWTDSTTRIATMIKADSLNFIDMFRSTVDNTIQFNFRANSVIETVATTDLGGSLDWFMLAMTWDVSADEMKAYVNGAQVGSTQSGLGTWVLNLDDQTNVIGAASVLASSVWDGWLAHYAIWNRALSLAEIQRICRAGGIST